MASAYEYPKGERRGALSEIAALNCRCKQLHFLREPAKRKRRAVEVDFAYFGGVLRLMVDS